MKIPKNGLQKERCVRYGLLGESIEGIVSHYTALIPLITMSSVLIPFDHNVLSVKFMTSSLFSYYHELCNLPEALVLVSETQ